MASKRRNMFYQNKKQETTEIDVIMGIRDEGMPFKKNPFKKGNLYIGFNIEFPKNNFADENKYKELEMLLGGRPTVVIPTGENVEEVNMHDYDPNDDRDKRKPTLGEAYDIDDAGPSQHSSPCPCVHQ
ncbi:hypothetical protein AAG570_001696 [Ranatra chinensis]|uniref:Uncharacterized protein n=1 Tax=Ranatra chinensis TaxID=642074 RepID=A0ABD0Y9A6_9HEMI